MTPAFSHFLSSRISRLSPMRCSTNRINQSREIVSKYARTSASTIQLTFRFSIPYLITSQAKRNLSSRSGIGGVLSAT